MPRNRKKNEENMVHVHKFCSTIKKNEICGNLDGIGNYCSMTEAHREKFSLLCLLCKSQVFICIYVCALICTWGCGSCDQKWHPKKRGLKEEREESTRIYVTWKYKRDYRRKWNQKKKGMGWTRGMGKDQHGRDMMMKTLLHVFFLIKIKSAHLKLNITKTSVSQIT